MFFLLQLAVGSTLHFEFYVDPAAVDTQTEESESSKTGAEGETTEVTKPTEERASSGEGDDSTKKEEGQQQPPQQQQATEIEDIGAPPSGQTVIHVPNLHRFRESNLEILEQLVRKYRIPRRYHFPLLIRIRLARAFPSLEERRNFVRVNLLAFTILADQAQSDVSLMNSFFLYEPEYISELMELVRSDASMPADFRILSLKALTALLADNTRLQGLISATGSSQHHGELPSMIRKSVATLTGSVEHPVYTLPFIEALFTFLSSLMATQDGIIALNNAGAIASLLPLLNDNDSRHSTVLLKCLNILEFYISASSSAISSSASMSLFRDLGGLDSLVGRWNREIAEIQNQVTAGEPMVVEVVEDEGKGKEKVTEPEQREGSPKHFPPSLPLFSSLLLHIFILSIEKQIDHRKRTLLKTLARVILPFVQRGGRRRNVGRLTSVIDGPFPASLRFILQHYKLFSDTLFSTGKKILFYFRFFFG